MSAAHDLALSRNMLKVEDVDLIREAVAAVVRPRKRNMWAVNLGAGSGTTTLAVLEASADLGVAAFVDCFDISHENLAWCELAVLNIGRAQDHYSHCMDSVEAATHFAHGEIDLLLIDTSHEYAHTVAEIAAWRGKLGRRGLVWLHDYVGDYPGVTQAVDEAIAAGVLEKVEARGLGVLCRYRPARKARQA